MRQFNDRKAPRLGKAEFSTNIVNVELYKAWAHDNPDYQLTYKEFILVWDEIVESIRTEVTINPMGIRLPFYTGDIIVQFLPNKVKSIDQEVSNQEKENLPFLNIITKGKVAKISWIRKHAIKFNTRIILFAFQQSRVINKKLAEVLWNTPEIFRKIKG